MTSTRVLMATTLAAFVMDQPDTWGAWLRNAEELRATTPASIDFFTAIQVDARGEVPFKPLIDRLVELQQDNPRYDDDVAGDVENVTHWTYMLDDRRTRVTTDNRLRHITAGQNLTNDRACAGDYTHLMFTAADCQLPDDGIAKLLEVGEHVVGAWCPTYGLPTVNVIDNTAYSPPCRDRPYPLHTFVDPDVLAFSAAAVMLDREAFRKLRWRWDRDVGMTDDPCLQHDAWYNHGWPVYVRPDVRTRHFPESIGPIETRGHDMSVHR